MWPLVRAHREIEQGRSPANGRARTRAAHGHPPGRRTCAAPGGVQRTPPARGEVPAARPPAPFPCRDTDPKTAIAIGSNTAQYWCSCSRTKYESRKDIFLPACKYRAIIRPACTYRGDFLLASKFLPALPPFHSCECPLLAHPASMGVYETCCCRWLSQKACQYRNGRLCGSIEQYRAASRFIEEESGPTRSSLFHPGEPSGRRKPHRGSAPSGPFLSSTHLHESNPAPSRPVFFRARYRRGKSHPAACVCAHRARTPPRPRTRRNLISRHTGERTTPRHARVHSEHAPFHGLAHVADPAEFQAARLQLNG